MRKSSDELAWIHKPLANITTVDIEGYITDRLDVVKPSTVDREIDRFKSIFKVVLSVWDYLNKSAGIRMLEFVADDTEEQVLELDAPVVEQPTAQPPATPYARPTHANQGLHVDLARVLHEQGASSGNVIAFPPARIVRAATSATAPTAASTPRDSAA